jgi:hypothetical protein
MLRDHVPTSAFTLATAMFVFELRTYRVRNRSEACQGLQWIHADRWLNQQAPVCVDHVNIISVISPNVSLGTGMKKGDPGHTSIA